MYTPLHSPQANASERVNRTIISAIRSYVQESHTNWDNHVDQIQTALVNTVHSSTGYSPHFLSFGQHLILHGKTYELMKELQLVDDNLASVYSNANKLSYVQDKVLKHLKKAYERQSKQYNLRTKPRNFHVGQSIFIRNFAKSDAVAKYNAKLGPKYVKGKISRVIGNVAYEVVDLNNKVLGIYHTKDIRE